MADFFIHPSIGSSISVCLEYEKSFIDETSPLNWQGSIKCRLSRVDHSQSIQNAEYFYKRNSIESE